MDQVFFAVNKLKDGRVYSVSHLIAVLVLLQKTLSFCAFGLFRERERESTYFFRGMCIRVFDGIGVQGVPKTLQTVSSVSKGSNEAGVHFPFCVVVRTSIVVSKSVF